MLKYGKINLEGMVNMNNGTKRLQQAIKQAAASVWMERMPLSKEYVVNYYKRRLAEQKKTESPKLTLKRDDNHGRKI